MRLVFNFLRKYTHYTNKQLFSVFSVAEYSSKPKTSNNVRPRVVERYFQIPKTKVVGASAQAGLRLSISCRNYSTSAVLSNPVDVQKQTPSDFLKCLAENKISRCFVVNVNNEIQYSNEVLRTLLPEEYLANLEFEHEAIFFNVGTRTKCLLAAFLWRTNRGQGAGGVHFIPFNTIGDMILDGNRFSRGLGIKSALAGLWAGGGKGIIAAPSDKQFDLNFRRDVFKDFGDFLTSLNGCIVTGAGVGSSVQDMDTMFSETRYISNIPPEYGGAVNTYVYTGLGKIYRDTMFSETRYISNIPPEYGGAVNTYVYTGLGKIYRDTMFSETRYISNIPPEYGGAVNTYVYTGLGKIYRDTMFSETRYISNIPPEYGGAVNTYVYTGLGKIYRDTMFSETRYISSIPPEYGGAVNTYVYTGLGKIYRDTMFSETRYISSVPPEYGGAVNTYVYTGLGKIYRDTMFSETRYISNIPPEYGGAVNTYVYTGLGKIYRVTMFSETRYISNIPPEYGGAVNTYVYTGLGKIYRDTMFSETRYISNIPPEYGGAVNTYVYTGLGKIYRVTMFSETRYISNIPPEYGGAVNTYVYTGLGKIYRDTMFSETRYISNIPPEYGGAVNTYVYTGLGVVKAMEAAIEYLGLGTLKGKTVALQGAGSVGQVIIDELLEKDVKHIYVSECNGLRANDVQDMFAHKADGRLTVNKVSFEDTSIFRKSCDIFSPCARGKVLNETTIPLLDTKIICGASNIPVCTEEDHLALMERKITYVTDVVPNRMGIVNKMLEPYGRMNEDPDLLKHLSYDWYHSIYQTTLRILRMAEEQNIHPEKAAYILGEELSLENHPLLPNRTLNIINELINSGWHEGKDFWKEKWTFGGTPFI
ncbi:hypothetical protein ACF0H5_014712 [Mactra antiquata]